MCGNADHREILTESTLAFLESHAAELQVAYEKYAFSKSREFAGRILETPSDQLQLKLDDADILLLTATDIETGVLWGWINACLTGKAGESADESSAEFVRVYDQLLVYTFFDWHRYRVVHVSLGHTGSDPRGGSSDALREVFSRWIPPLVVTPGVAFGMDFEEQELGDVVVARRCVAYDRGIKMADGDIIPKELPTFEIDQRLDGRIRSHPCFLGDGVYYGTVLSGESVLDDAAHKSKILSSVARFSLMDSKPIGGEMEGFGIFKECGRVGVPALLMKGICDWGAGKNALSEDREENDAMKDRIQSYAMSCTLDKLDVLMRSPYLLKFDEGKRLANEGRDQDREHSSRAGARDGSTFVSIGDNAIQAGRIDSIEIRNG